MNLYEFLLGCVVTGFVTLGVVMLIDYERERKWREKMYRRSLERWFSRKMYNYYTYGDVTKNSPISFEEEHPEYSEQLGSNFDISFERRDVS